ncbi:heterokaryon incompatibility protein-domain-containing protein [Annulohypoxylon moriforme]|nr:heterokaryon incompatibility protein-domain-containing protein [Annulohypoxylon moriforme]
MEHIPLDSEPKYYALSYVWGDSREFRTIELDGQPFKITKNLHEALHQFRQLTDPEYIKDYFWVDAICIDQTDHDEKSQEVPRMSEIYRVCLQVLIWLGPNGPPTNSKVVKIGKLLRKLPLQKLSSKTKHLDKLFNPGEATPDDVVEEMLGYKIMELMLAFGDDDNDDVDDEELVRKVYGSSYRVIISAWVEIMSRPWFTRTWTIQEACIPTDPIFYIGRHDISLGMLSEAIRILAVVNRTLLKCVGTFRILMLSKLRDMRIAIFDFASDINPIRMETGDVLSEIMGFTYMKQCENPLDQIYGIIGLIEFLAHDIPPELMPNYDLPYEELYWRCTAYMLESNGDLRLLGTYYKNFKTGPSWVADFRYMRLTTVKMKSRPCVSVSPDRRILSVQGILIGEYKNHIYRCDTQAVLPHPERIPKSLSVRLTAVEEKILKPSALIRKTTVEKTIDGCMVDGRKIFNRFELESCRSTFRRLSTTHGEKSWVAKKRVNLSRFSQEYTIADEFSHGYMLLDNGTVVRLDRQNAKMKPGDLVCIFKGSAQASILRPCGENYEFVSQGDIRAGEFANMPYNDEFWEGREMQEFNLV